MRILYIADARSPIAQNWITHFIATGHDVHVISSYPCAENVLPGASVYQLPIAFSQLSRIRHNGTVSTGSSGSSGSFGRGVGLVTRGLASVRSGALSRYSLAMFSWLGPIEIERHVQALRKLISEIAPDLVHAMRIPYEGILASKAAPHGIPLIVSVWGNDFTLFANRNRLLARQTKECLQRVDALHCDCQRDLKLASDSWSFQPTKPAVVLPGGGGVQASMFRSQPTGTVIRKRFGIPSGARVIINPRGFRPYVRNDTFFRSLPLILKEQPDALFLAIGMEGNPTAEKWLEKLGLSDSVRLLPPVPRETMADLFRLACVTVSPSDFDGTPNTLLEAMACGCFPIAGNIESLREWITDGANGMLCDQSSPQSLANAVVRALQDDDLRSRAAVANQKLIGERADYQQVMTKAEGFYKDVVGASRMSDPLALIN